MRKIVRQNTSSDGKEQSRALERGITVKFRDTYTVGVYGCGFANGELNFICLFTDKPKIERN